jgi:acetolactate synthase-1/2/3 large subunit
MVVHPTQIVTTLRDLLPDETIVACDIGSNYVWMARHFRTFEPRRLLFSNGQQTLGVALPWAIAASLVEPGRKVVSVWSTTATTPACSRRSTNDILD